MSEFVTKPIPDIQPDIALVTRPWGSFKQYANNSEEIGRASCRERVLNLV